MYDASRTARRVTGRRRPTVGVVLVAVLLALFATSGGGGAETVRVERAGSGTVAWQGLNAHPATPGHPSPGLHAHSAAGLHPHPATPGRRPGREAAARPPGQDASGPSTGPDATGRPRGTHPAGQPHGTDPAGHRPGAVPRAHEDCATVCSTRAGGRHELDGERQTPPHLATTTDATALPPTAPARTPLSGEPAPRSPGHTVHDRGRAPPASPGI